MVTFDPASGWTYQFTNKANRLWYEDTVACFGFLLNTPERRRRSFTWQEFAFMMRTYSTHEKTEALAAIIEK